MPEPKAKGKGLGKKVAGLPVWVWGVALIGGLLVGIYLRRSGGGSSGTTTTTTPTDTSGLGDLSGVATTPSANGLGSSTTDGTGALDTSALQMSLDSIASQLAVMTQNAQDQANFGAGGFLDNGGNFMPSHAGIAPVAYGSPTGAVTVPGGILVAVTKAAVAAPKPAKAKGSKKPATRKGSGRVPARA